MARKLTVKIIDNEKYAEATGETTKKKTVNLFPDEAEYLFKIEAVELTPMQKAILEENKPKEQETTDTSKEAIELAKQEDFFDQCIKEVQKKVVGEEKTIETVGIISAGRLVENANPTSYNGSPNEESGTGKDFVTRNTLFIFVPMEDLVYRTRISPTVLNYWHNPKFEPEWTWDGKVLYLEDVSDNILNSDVMKTFLSGGSKATIVIKQMVVDIHIKGKPVMIMTFANTTPNNEMLRRIQLIPLDSTKQQTEKIKKFKAKKASIGVYEGKNEKISEAISSLKRIKVKIPEDVAESVIEYFPNTTIVRTNLDRFFDFMKASCAFHQHNRKIEEDGYYLANGQDYNIARDIFLYVTFSKNMIPISKNQRKLLDLFPKMEGKYSNEKTRFSVAEIENAVTFMSKKSLYVNLNLLSDSGFLKKDKDEEEHGSGENTWTKDVTIYQRIFDDVFYLPEYEELINPKTTTLTTPSKQATFTTRTTSGVKSENSEELKCLKTPQNHTNEDNVVSVEGVKRIITPLKGGSVDDVVNVVVNEETKKNKKTDKCSNCGVGLNPDFYPGGLCEDCGGKKLSPPKEEKGVSE